MTLRARAPFSEAAFERMASEDARALVALLTSGDVPNHLLTYAAEIAGRELRSDLVVPPLLELLTHAAEVVREGAILGLDHHVGAPGVLDRLAHLATHDASHGVRTVAAAVAHEVP